MLSFDDGAQRQPIFERPEMDRLMAGYTAFDVEVMELVEQLMAKHGDMEDAIGCSENPSVEGLQAYREFRVRLQAALMREQFHGLEPSPKEEFGTVSRLEIYRTWKHLCAHGVQVLDAEPYTLVMRVQALAAHEARELDELNAEWQGVQAGELELVYSFQDTVRKHPRVRKILHEVRARIAQDILRNRPKNQTRTSGTSSDLR